LLFFVLQMKNAICEHRPDESGLDERLRRFGGTGSQQIALRDEAMNHIRLAPDREQAFATITGEMDMALTRSRGLGLG
jgi:hypothetical protein